MNFSQAVKVPIEGSKHDLMYHVNGTGRDTYIFNNNGGFAASKIHHIASSSQLRQKPSPSQSPIRQCIIESRPRIYVQDGSGRDGYILENNGGNTCSGQIYNRKSDKLFQANLRNYERDGDYLNRH